MVFWILTHQKQWFSTASHKGAMRRYQRWRQILNYFYIIVLLLRVTQKVIFWQVEMPIIFLIQKCAVNLKNYAPEQCLLTFFWCAASSLVLKIFSGTLGLSKRYKGIVSNGGTPGTHSWHPSAVVLNVGSMAAYQRPNTYKHFSGPRCIFLTNYFAHFRPLIELILTHFVVSWCFCIW